MKEKINQIKEFTGKLSSRTKKLIIAGAAVLLIGAVAAAFILNNKPYGVLFSGLGTEEAQEVVARLQEDGVEFKYQDDSTILVQEDQLDVTKAKLVQEGYPKSGFTYDTFKENAGMMTTDSDKNTYKLYELQDRIGSTIRLFDGVKDAKVTIALGEESKYALNDEAKEKSSASAVVTMEDGGSPTKEQAEAIQRLVSKSIPNMAMEDVAVFDGNGNDISGETGAAATSSDAEEIAKVVEDQIAQRVMKILGSVYGEENVRVSARAEINMERLIRESTTYSTPEKINQNDKAGIVGKEETYKEESNSGNGTAGVPGTETNADTPQYNTDSTAGTANANSESVSREFLVDQIKEQGQIDPGALDDLTISVVINGNGYGDLNEQQVRSLVANASGIAAEDQAAKISIATAPFYKGEEDGEEDQEVSGKAEDGFVGSPLFWALIAAGVLLVIAAVVVILMIRRKKKNALAAEEETEVSGDEYSPMMDMNQELQEIQNDRGMELKRNIREFAEQNAEISAQLLKNWLNGGDGNGE
nr:flagellar basal-body MS-ring/collar protein FliF [uncultured Faecalimonas sp.]